jgi:glycosyltransferase involved in cell wall biosynthesis
VKILFIHNDYYEPSGEEHAVESISSVLEEKGHRVIWYRRGSNELDHISGAKVKAALYGIYNPASVRAVCRILDTEKPDLVQVQNLYPLISPPVLASIKKRGIPVVMRCPNYRMWCPTGLFLDNANTVCEKCLQSGKETWCVRKNCTGNIMKSTAYALRNYVARKTGVFQKNVDAFIVQTEFQRKKFVSLGVPEAKIFILPGMTPQISSSWQGPAPRFFSFIGRVSKEKGIEDFARAARALPHLEFAVAGRINERTDLSNLPGNVQVMGFLKEVALNELYHNSRAVIVPSRWYEGFPNVIAQAMWYEKPVIASRIGCFVDIISHGQNGLLFDYNNPEALEQAIATLDENPEMAERIGRAGKFTAEKLFGKDKIYQQLMEVYRQVLHTPS